MGVKGGEGRICQVGASGTSGLISLSPVSVAKSD